MTGRPVARIRSAEEETPLVRLAQVIDLEFQLAADGSLLRAGRGADVLKRDRAIGERIKEAMPEGVLPTRESLEQDRDLRARLALAWLEDVRTGQTSLGERMERGYRFCGALLLVLGLFIGGGTASATLSYNGQTPINVFVFLGVLVALQLLLLLLMLGFLLLRRATRRSGPGVLERAIKTLSGMRFVDRFLFAALPKAREWASGVRSHQTLYGGVERWLLFALIQRFACAFNVGALGTALFLVTFSDLAFSWSTTLSIDGATLDSWFRAVASPWTWFLPDAAPSLATIEQSQWVRLHGEGFVGGRNLKDALTWARDWWPFLLMSLFTYGLLPRLLASAYGEWRYRRELRALSFDHAPFLRLWERLLPKDSHWDRPSAESVGHVPELPEVAPVPRAQTPQTPKKPDARPRLLLWGNLAERREELKPLANRRLRTEFAPPFGVGGASLEDDDRCIVALSKAAPSRLLLLLEVGMQPTKEVRHFLRRLRDATTARTPIEVMLVMEANGTWRGADADEWAQWDRVIATEGDPHLHLLDWGSEA